MNNTTNENLREMLAGFMDESAARQTAEDIEKGGEVLGAYSAPEPDEEALAEVKKNVAAALKRKRTVVFQRRVLIAVSTAAVIVIALIAQMHYDSQRASTQTPLIANSVWEGADDADVTVLKAEIENIQNELSGAQSDYISTGGTNTAVGDLETELIDTNGDIWKG